MRHLLLALSMLLAESAFCQKVHVGPELGMNAIQIERNDFGKDFQPGWYAGIAFEYDFLDYFAIKSGFYYSQKRQTFGSKDTVEFALLQQLGFEIPGVNFDSYTSTEGRQVQNYFEFPVMAQYQYKEFSGYFGPYFAWMFNARSIEREETYAPFTQAIDFNEFDNSGTISAFLPAPFTEKITEKSTQKNLRIFDYGLKVGVAYQTYNVGINISYQYGFTDYRIDKGENDLQNHQFFQISLNYMFNLGKKKDSQSRL